MYNGFCPPSVCTRTQPKDRATSASRVTIHAGRAVKIARAIKHESAKRTVSVRSALETVKHSLIPACAVSLQLINRTQAVRAPRVCSAIKIAELVRNEAAKGRSGIRLNPECINGFELPFSRSRRCKLESHALPVCPTARGHTIKMSMRNQQPSCRSAEAIRTPSKSMKHPEVPVARRVRRQAEYHTATHAEAAAHHTAGGGHAIDVALFVKNQWTPGAGAIRAASESVDYRLRPGSIRLGQLVNHATAPVARGITAGYSCAVEISRRIEGHAFVRFGAIGAPVEAIEHDVPA